ncbi:2'-5' RNA ligase [Microbacterium sp. H6]|uniref:2'-5' RNA ligase n=1 Tax=Microbacterium sp. H6 TaxID=421122 RepID=UPI000DE45248|nr:2'-5' RNA ligase [Microbacterium sp. H6]RBO73489.1 2'-5' RNA ligase [Microbacterium sp. H6]
MRIDALIDMDAVADEIAAGYVTEKTHPEFPQLRILNYTDRCQFDRHWNQITRLTRGIIYDAETREVLARPFPKIHNHGEPDAGELNLDEPIMGAFDKLDGSLGITYMRPDGLPAIATRGSFTSEQAVHATRWLRDSPWGEHVGHGIGTYTWLWEIIYPENRIVIDYGDRDELVYLGAIAHETGDYSPPYVREEELASTTEIYAGTLRDALAIPPRLNAEGLVVWLDFNRAVKIKQADYVELHRIVSNLTVKEVWRQLRAGTFDGFVVALPDEFHAWARDTSAPLIQQHRDVAYAASIWLDLLAHQGLETRKDQALFITSRVAADMRGLVFSLLDGKSIDDAIWRMIEPKVAPDA